MEINDSEYYTFDTIFLFFFTFMILRKIKQSHYTYNNNFRFLSYMLYLEFLKRP